jgi:Secretion system C-terminal sorting domain
MEVVVFDITGKRVLTKNTNSSTVQLSTEELTGGVYFVKVTSEGSSSTYKVVK